MDWFPFKPQKAEIISPLQGLSGRDQCREFHGIHSSDTLTTYSMLKEHVQTALSTEQFDWMYNSLGVLFYYSESKGHKCEEGLKTLFGTTLIIMNNRDV